MLSIDYCERRYNADCIKYGSRSNAAINDLFELGHAYRENGYLNNAESTYKNLINILSSSSDQEKRNLLAGTYSWLGYVSGQ